MPGNDLISFDSGVRVPAPLSLRLRRCPFNSVHSVIIDGPPGAVELQIRPALLGPFGSGMSIEYHSRQPKLGAEHPQYDCEVLDGATCYPDGITLGAHSEFALWFGARNSQAIVDELVRRHHGTTWTLDGRNESLHLPLSRAVPPWA